MLSTSQRLHKSVWLFASLIVASIFSLSLLLYMQHARPVQAVGLDVTIIAGYNLVVDSNVSSQSTAAPEAATVMGQFCNTSGSTAVDAVAYIGNYNGGVSSTPGIYPVRDSAGFGTEHPHLLNTGDYSFTHLGGRIGLNDATRYLGDIPAGECRVQYWHFTYPRCENLGDGTPVDPPCGSQEPVWGQTNVDSDDLWLELDVWSDAASGQSGSASWRMTMRNEISAMANKIQPNPNGQWFNTNTSIIAPGDVITSNGILYELGNINKGFDNDGDFDPDYNAWLQPIGDANYDPSCFRLIGSSGVLTVSRSGGLPDLPITFDNQLYFTDLPANNNGVIGEVFYTFMALDGPCSTSLTPYQEVASGFNNEKYNSDFGTWIPPIVSSAPNVAITKTGDTTVSEPGTITYNIPMVNSGTADAGLPFSSDYGTGLPLVISDTIPAGLVYVASSAMLSGDVTATILYYNTATSAWESTEPAAANVGAIQWWLNDSLPANGGAVNASFQASVPVGYIAGGGATFIENDACASFGNGVSFACDDAVTAIQGTSTIGDFVWADEDYDGQQDVGEAGIDNITVYLYWDRNDDGIIDDGDLLIDTQVTAGGGAYDFTQLPIGDYIVAVDGSDPDLPTGYNHTTAKTVDVDITANGTDFNDADFGFGPILDLTKTLINGEVDGVDNDNLYEGQLATYVINVINTRPGGVPPNNACQYVSWVGSAAHVGGLNTQWSNIGLAESFSDANYALATTGNNDQEVTLSNFDNLTIEGNITNVSFVLYLQEVDDVNSADASLVLTIDSGGNSDAITYATEFDPISAGTVFQLSNETWTNIVWDGTSFSGITPSVLVEYKKSGGNNAITLGMDAAAFVVTTDATCGDAADTLNPVPVVDTYDPTELEFVSADPPVTSQSAGTLNWSNVGPLLAGATEQIAVTFKVLGTSGVTTNTVNVTNAEYIDGRDANDAEDDEPADLFDAHTIGDYVWFDANGNGTQDETNAGIAGVVVELYLSSNDTIFYNGSFYTNGDLIITTTTDANGAYLFEGVPPGADYEVVIDPSIGVNPMLTALNPTTITDGNFGDDNAGAEGDMNALSADVLTADFGFENDSMIYGKIWHDANADSFDTGENDIAGVTVELQDGVCSTGVDCPTAVTDENGFYQFTGVTDGTYTIVVLTPPGTQVSEPTGANTTDTCVNTGSCDNTTSVTVAGANIYGAYDFGYSGADIGDTLYVDWNGDGSQGVGEEGIPNVDVLLYSDLDGDGIVEAEDSLLETDTTDANGNYLFENYPAGGYVVVVNTGDTDFPASYVQTADPDSTVDNQHALTTDGTNDDLDVDFGYQPQGTSSIGDYVWNDADSDGIQDAGEVGIDDITVTLYQDQNGNGVIDAEDAVISTTTTVGGGFYDFPNLAAGNYLVDVDTGDPELPNDGDGNDYVLSTNNDPHPVALGSGEDYDDADFGFSPGGVIGDYIWSDNNGDGVQDLGEPPLAGVVVELQDGTCTSGVDCPTTTTDANGLYEFTGLPAGTYTVEVLSGVPSGYSQTGDPDATGSCTTDPSNACDSSSTVVLTPGQVDRSRDFGFKPAAVIGDFVWLDQNGDGVQDPGEPGLPNVVITVTLQGGAVYTTTTDSDGYYTVSGAGTIPAGTHTVEVDTSTLPAGVTATHDLDGGNDDTASGITDGSSDRLDFDFGYQYSGLFSISGVVFEDASMTGAPNATTVDAQSGELTYVDVPVYLWRFNGSGYDLIAETTSIGGNGYLFSDLPDGMYVVSVSDGDPSLSGATFTTNDGAIYDGGAIQNDGQAFENVTIAGADQTNVDFGFTGGSPTAVTLSTILVDGVMAQSTVLLIIAILLLATTYIVYRRQQYLS